MKRVEDSTTKIQRHRDDISFLSCLSEFDTGRRSSFRGTWNLERGTRWSVTSARSAVSGFVPIFFSFADQRVGSVLIVHLCHSIGQGCPSGPFAFSAREFDVHRGPAQSPSDLVGGQNIRVRQQNHKVVVPTPDNDLPWTQRINDLSAHGVKHLIQTGLPKVSSILFEDFDMKQNETKWAPASP